MTDSTRKTIIRHLKGIVSALEKEESVPKVITYKGTELGKCSDDELKEAWDTWIDDSCSHYLPNYFEFDRELRCELRKRGLHF